MAKKKRKVKGSRSHRRKNTVPEKTSSAWSTWKLLISVATVVGLIGIAAFLWHGEGMQLNKAAPTTQEAKNGKPSPAERYLAAIARDPANDDAHYNLGLLLHQQGKLSEAISRYQQALSITPDSFDYHNNLAAALAAQGRLDDAIMHFQEALSLDSDSVKANFNLGNALFSQGQHEAAMKQFRRVIELDPSHARAHNNLAVALKETGQLQEAYRYRNEAMRLEREQQSELPQ